MVDQRKEDIILAYFYKMLNDLKKIVEKENIEKGELENLIKNYERKLKRIENYGFDGRTPDFVVKYGESYVINEENPEKCFIVFEQILNRGGRGLCITRTSPESIELFNRNQNIEYIWLTKMGMVKNERFQTFSPTDLSKITGKISDFVKENGKNKSIVLFEGVEFLITNNSFNDVMRMLSTVKDIVQSNKGVFLVSMNMNTLKEEEKNIIKREFPNQFSF